MRAWWIPVGFLVYGLVVGLLSAEAWYPGIDGPFALPYLLNFPGELLGEQLYHHLARPRAPLDVDPVAGVLGRPQVFVPASAAFWGLLGLGIWGGWKALLGLDRWLVWAARRRRAAG